MPPTDNPKRFPGESDEGYPEVFTIKPPQPTEKKPGQLPQHMIDQFFNDGYVIVDKFFDCEKELEPCKKAIEQDVDKLANKLFKGGKIKQLYNEYGLRDRLIHIENEFPGANIILHKSATLAQAYRDLWTNERLLNVVEQFIGPEISGNPVWNLRTKTPNNEATTVPWHQDSAYLDNRAYQILQPTAWIPLIDATEKNGCMRVVSGGHRTGKVALHQCCWGGTTYIMVDEAEMTKTLGADMEKDVVLCPVPYGGMLLINNAIPHHSLPNLTDEIRWSLDLRWQKTGLPASFYDLQECVEFRSPTKPNLKIDWSQYDGVNRHDVAAKDMEDEQILKELSLAVGKTRIRRISHNLKSLMLSVEELGNIKSKHEDPMRMMEAVKYIEKHTQWHQGSKTKVNSIITVNNDVLESDIAAVLNTKELEAPRIHIFSTESELQGIFIAFDSVFSSIAKAEGVMAAVLKLLATYYMFDLEYPKPFSMVLGIMQTFVMEEPYKKETSKKYKTFIKSLRSIYNKYPNYQE